MSSDESGDGASSGGRVPSGATMDRAAEPVVHDTGSAPADSAGSGSDSGDDAHSASGDSDAKGGADSGGAQLVLRARGKVDYRHDIVLTSDEEENARAGAGTGSNDASGAAKEASTPSRAARAPRKRYADGSDDDEHTSAAREKARKLQAVVDNIKGLPSRYHVATILARRVAPGSSESDFSDDEEPEYQYLVKYKVRSFIARGAVAPVLTLWVCVRVLWYGGPLSEPGVSQGCLAGPAHYRAAAQLARPAAEAVPQQVGAQVEDRQRGGARRRVL